VADACNAVDKDGKIPVDWSKSWLASVYKGKGDVLEYGSHSGIKMLEHVWKTFKGIIEVEMREKVKIDNMQFGFMWGKWTTDAIFIVRQLQEKYIVKKIGLWMAFVDLEKAFHWIPRKVVWWEFRSPGVDERLVPLVESMYEDATIVLRVNCCDSNAFGVMVGVHQGSELSPLLFVLVLEALSSK